MWKSRSEPPADAQVRRRARSTVVYPADALRLPGPAIYEAARSAMTRISDLTVPPRGARAFPVPAGHLFRIVCVEGAQVGDLNVWNTRNLSERFFSGKTRAIHATHVSTGDRLWSTLPYLRPLATRS
jgi:uncharacterized protein YcgI (DUF1989 family)